MDFDDGAAALDSLPFENAQVLDLRVVADDAPVLQRVEERLEGVVRVALAPVGWMERDDHSQRAGEHGPAQ